MEPSASQEKALPHVLLAVDQLTRSLGGGERVLLRMAALLPQYGYRVSILTLGADPQSPALSEPVPCPIYLLELHRTYGLDALRAARDLRRFLREQKIQLVQTFFESSDLWVGPVARLTSKAKLIWSRRDMGILRGRKHQIAYRLMARLPAHVFAVSEQVRRYCIEVDGIPEQRVETLYNGLDLAEWRKLPERARSGARATLVTVGNIRRVKGHDIFLRAAAVIAKEFPDARFSIGGGVLEPEFYAELQALVEELQLGDRVHFAGNVTDLRTFLEGADVFVFPSRSEGFSNAIIEAMAAALPVVATDAGGNAEAVENGVTGRIVPSEDVPSLAAAMRAMLLNPERAREMGLAARARVAERFTTEAMMSQLAAAYREVLQMK